jgi:hypothetical protein
MTAKLGYRWHLRKMMAAKVKDAENMVAEP